MLQLVDPNVLDGDEVMTTTPLHHLPDLVDDNDYSTHESQLILAKQLIAHGANVDALSIPLGETPVHKACTWGNVTNLDFGELLLEEGVDPNVQNDAGLTALMCATKFAPGAVKFLLNWPTTDAHITSRSGASFLTKVKQTIVCFL